MAQGCLELDAYAALSENEFDAPLHDEAVFNLPFGEYFSNPLSAGDFVLSGVPAQASLLSWWALQSPDAELLEEKRQGKAELPGDTHSADGERGSTDGWCIANYKMQIWHFRCHIYHSHRYLIEAYSVSI